LPTEITPVFTDYVSAYKVDDALFPYTPRFVRYLITETAQKAGVKKKVSAQILRDTCAIRQLKRGYVRDTGNFSVRGINPTNNGDLRTTPETVLPCR
jgi:integrase/recombinase XerD